MAVNAFITCPTNCAALTLPILDTNQDCFSSDGLSLSQITGVILLSKKDSSGATNTFPAANTLVGWSAVIDNTDTTGAKAKRLTVEGSMPAPELSTVQLPKFKTVTKYRTYTLTGIVKQMSTNNFDFFRNMMCGGFVGYVWFITEDYIYGGITAPLAVEVDTIDANIVFDGAADSYVQGDLIIKWKSSTFPSRIANFGF